MRLPGFINKLLTINRFLNVFQISRKLLVVIFLLLILQAAGEALSATLIMPFLDSFRSIQGAGAGTSRILETVMSFFKGLDTPHRFMYILLSIFLILTVTELIFILNNKLILRFSMFDVQDKVSNQVFSHILDARLKFFYKQRSGDLINLLTNDVNRGFCCIKHLLDIIRWSIFICGYICISLLLLPVYTFGLLAIIAVIMLVFKKASPYLYSLGQDNLRAQEDASNIIVETMQGFRSIVLACAQDIHKSKFKEIIHRFYYTIYNNTWITSSVQPFMRFLSFLLLALVILFNKRTLLGGDPAYFSKMFFFIYVTGNIFRGLGIINSLYSSFAFNYEGVLVLLKTDEELKAMKINVPSIDRGIRSFSRMIEVKNLSFGYGSGESEVFTDLTFTVQASRKVAFAGSSGSGKSTLIDVISGFHDDYKGSILVDGEELKNIDKKDWRQLLGYVSQETFIFNDTIENNLLFGFQRKIGKEEIIQACKNAQIYDTIMSFAKKFDTELGERGVRLSGGEKQRLAIARLFLKDPLIVLLDEATSSLDSESEKRVKEALNSLSQGRTVIAASHRLSTIGDFDAIHILEKGRLVESGSHAQLLARKGYYFRYYTIQTMEDNR
ncbi:MAG TPA: hypothetical protein DCL49_13160 [Candidatus Omnitrophica bacterium]|nr:MAG: hypothetical protein A3E74_04355 [Omnitrophica bacterium RIFCSPHIGHO2_12_FULL_44_12]HAH21834.1 hypothetical protein [Candidatus Omnitrophota bacterium]